MRLTGSCLLFAVMLYAVSGDANDDIRESVVKVHSTSRPPDFLRPWCKSSAKRSSGSGVVIQGKRILTNAHVVLYATQIFVQPFQSTDKIAASVVAVAPGMDLAVLKLEDESFFENRMVPEMADGIPNTRDAVNVYGYPVGGDQLSVTEGIISRLEHAGFGLDTTGLRIQVDAALNPGNSGGPAIADGRIVGLVFSKMSKADNIGYLIAVEEIKMFLKDIEDGTYDGKPMIFDDLQSTENDALRSKLRLSKEMGGVMVNKPYRDGDNYPLKAWDVITHVGDEPLDSQGRIKIKDDLRLSFGYLLPKIVKDGTVSLKIFRNGESLKVDVPVQVEPDRLMRSLKGGDPRYFIYGPMVFTAATQELLVVLQKGKMLNYLALRKSPLATRRYDAPTEDLEDLVVMGVRMFPHRITKGYGNSTFGVVTHVNDVKIKSLSHLVATLRDVAGPFTTFKIAGHYEKLVFESEKLLETTEEVLADEGIRYQFSKDLEEVWEGNN